MIRRVPVTPDIFDALRPAMLGDEEYFRFALESGECEAWEVNGGDAYMITRLEIYNDAPPELVVCCFAGRGLRAVAPVIVDMARRAGCASERFHTRRRGLHRLVADCGFRECGRGASGETIYRVAV